MFVKTKKGIIFESDHDGHLALIHDVSHSLLINPNIAGVEAKRLYEDAQDRIRERFKRKQLVGSGFFRLGKSERLLIQGNFLNCDEVGIEWSGTKKIIDFRIKDNDFIGCQDIAIQIEPDDRTMLLAEPVDTKVRLIENNRFNINTGAVRATIGSVRVEKNDIRVMSPELGFIPWEGVLIAAGDYVYRDNSLSEAAGESNFPGVRVEFKMASNTVKKNVSKIDSRNLSRELGEKILASHPPAKGDSGADLVHTAKILAEINALDSLAVLLDRKIPQVVNDLEGFAINLAGHRNRVIHNHIYSDNNRVFGGIVFHLLSGEVRDNEVCVPRLALLMNGKIAKSSSIDRVAEIVGNSLKVSGIQAAGGKTIPVYALSIPSLNLGNLSIMRNIFEGSVKIGSDPISSLGFFKKDKVEFEKIDAFYHEVTLDSGSFNMSIMAGMLSKAITPALMPNPELFIARPINLDILHIAEVVDIEYVKPIEDVVETVIPDPHLDKTVLQFADNRVIRGWLSISPNVAGSSLSIKDPQKPSGRALNIALSNNVIDLTAKVAGYDLIIVGNHSQNRIQYNADNYVAKNANIPPLS